MQMHLSPRNLLYIGLILLGIAVLMGAPQKLVSLVRGGSVALLCETPLSQEMLQEGLRLGTDFILESQRPEGNFEYQYDWITKTYTDDDNSVRQAGTLWGLALIYAFTHEERLIVPLEKAFTFFEKNSKVSGDGARHVVYPGEEEEGGLGTVALTALAHIEYLNARESEMTPVELSRHKKLLDGYLRFITQAVRPDKLYYSSYDIHGKHYGDASPYYDGEALLAMIKAARYRGYDAWEDQLKELADAGHAENVVAARKENADSDTTKGYYQWSSMAYHELFESGWEDTEKYGDYAIELADWMIDTHKVLTRMRNTGYAFEGIISAYAAAKDQDDHVHENKFRCVTEAGLYNLMTWQVGTTYQNDFIEKNYIADPKARGGIQNHRSEAPLRIDVTQHQMHAVIMALEHLYGEK